MPTQPGSKSEQKGKHRTSDPAFREKSEREEEGSSTTGVSAPPEEGEKERSPEDALQAQAEVSFLQLWKRDDADEILHSMSLSRDLKEEITKGDDAGEKEEQDRLDWDKKLKDMTLFNSGRIEKYRRQYLSEAAKIYERASEILRTAKEEKGRLTNVISRLWRPSAEQKQEISQHYFDNAMQVEQAIYLMQEARINEAKASKKRGKEEEEAVKQIKEECSQMLLNLYQTEAKNQYILPYEREMLMRRASGLKVYDSTSTRLSFAGEEILHEFEQYTELSEQEVFELSEANVYNRDEDSIRQVWGFFDGTEKDHGNGYVNTPNSHFVNWYLRIRYDLGKAEKRHKDAGERMRLAAEGLEEAKKAGSGLKEAQEEYNAAEEELRQAGVRLQDVLDERDRKLPDQMYDTYHNRGWIRKNVTKAAFKAEGGVFRTWLEKTEKLIPVLDQATGKMPHPAMETESLCLPHKTKVYRMVDTSILEWGFGIQGIPKVQDQFELQDSYSIVDALNQRTGTVITDHGVVSTGWQVDIAFKKRPVLITFLVDEGSRCFVTKNFREAEIVFERDTSYELVCAINHNMDPQVLPQSDPYAESTAKDWKGLRRTLAFDDDLEMTNPWYTEFRGIELVMRIKPPADKVRAGSAAGGTE